MNRKVRKLIRDPKLFFKDMGANFRRRAVKLLPRKHQGHHQYTVVSAVYNVGRYLDDYFQSLTKQRLDFRKHIHLVLVDDGSTDDSAQIIRRWQKRFPLNITYLHKKNGGQASARNMGLEHVRTEWVTFIDPDDFVDRNYFAEVDNFLYRKRDQDVRLLSCNFIFYLEDKGIYSDRHPLRYRFTKGDTLLDASDLQRYIQLHVNSVFFLSEQILRARIAFDNRIKPSFEDGAFVAEYLASLDGGLVGFSTASKYYYRKREDGSSTLDTAWKKVGRYTDVLEFGYLNSMRTYLDRFGYVPQYFQRTVLYELAWHVKVIANHPEVASFLSDAERAKYLSLLDELFALIEAKVVVDFDLAGCWFYHKVGMLACFKGQLPNFQIAYIEAYDPIKMQVLIRYFVNEVGHESYILDGIDTLPLFAKTVRHDFLDRTFVLERRVWIPALSLDQQLTLHLAGIETRISLGGKQHRGGVSIRDIATQFVTKFHQGLHPLYTGAWLFMDRDTQADDNAEHMYRYVAENYPERKAYFVLRRESHDWARLEAEGFRLLAFDSIEHEVALRSCSKIISSHADAYVHDYFGDKSLDAKHFVFLQHGVIQNDLSGWLNKKYRIDCFVTTTPAEFQSIADDGTRYKFGRKEVVLAGLPRHDALLRPPINGTRTILIMPTWRKELAGKPTGVGNERELNPEFMDSRFAKTWQSFLCSKPLQDMAQLHGYRVVFFPHNNIQRYLDQFELPEFIEIASHRQGSVQVLFREASLMVTDYSSVANEMGVQCKPVIYYQFDEEDVFAGGHICVRGYFDFHSDGFGPVVNEEAALLSELERLLANDCRPAPEHLARMKAFFPFRDGKNCERTYKAICGLDEPSDPDTIDLDIARDYAERASRAEDWSLAESRWRLILEKGTAEYMNGAWLSLVKALRQQGKLLEAKSILLAEDDHSHLRERKKESAWKIETAELFMRLCKWNEAAQILASVNDAEHRVLHYHLICLAELGRFDEATALVATFDSCRPPMDSQEVTAWLAVAERDWESVITSLTNRDEVQDRQPEWHLLLARAYRELGLFEEAHSELVAYEKHCRNNPLCRIEIARLAFTRQQWGKVIDQLLQAYPEGIQAMPLEDAMMLVQSQRLMGKLPDAATNLEILDAHFSEQIDIIRERAELASARKLWEGAIELWRKILKEFDYAPYRLAEAYRAIGQVDLGLDLLTEPSVRSPQTPDEWILRAELAHLSGAWAEAEDSWASLLKFHSEDAPDWVWERLQTAQLMNAMTQLPGMRYDTMRRAV